MSHVLNIPLRGAEPLKDNLSCLISTVSTNAGSWISLAPCWRNVGTKLCLPLKSVTEPCSGPARFPSTLMRLPDFSLTLCIATSLSTTLTFALMVISITSWSILLSFSLSSVTVCVTLPMSLTCPRATQMTFGACSLQSTTATVGFCSRYYAVSSASLLLGSSLSMICAFPC